MLSCITILHPYGFLNSCLTESCKQLHSKWNYNRSYCFKILLLSIAILPIFGQILGVHIIAVSIESYQESKNFYEKLESISYLFRGVITLLGLGIICLLIDIIVSCAILIRDCFLENTDEFENF